MFTVVWSRTVLVFQEPSVVEQLAGAVKVFGSSSEGG